MNRQDFKLPGGFPLETDTLDEMQKAYSLLNAFGEIAGDKAIIQGCVADGENVSDGVVYVDGEVFSFRGGPKRDTVIVKEDVVSKSFESGQEHEVLFKRYITFGSGEGSINWREFKRYRLVEEVVEFKDEVNEELAGKAPLSHDHDDRYYTEAEINRFRSHIRDYGYLTNIVYKTISYNATKTASFYSDNRVCCFMQISDMPELVTTGPLIERYDPEYESYERTASRYDTRVIRAEVTGGFVIKLGFAKIKITT